jgi:hypothetical protein
MIYELAKELKDAGFPFRQIKEDELALRGFERSQVQSGFVFGDGIEWFEPNLSELIEACGEGFFAISHWPEGWTAEGGPIIQGKDNLWTAQIQCKNLPTAEESVANLWLALHQ